VSRARIARAPRQGLPAAAAPARRDRVIAFLCLALLATAALLSPSSARAAEQIAVSVDKTDVSVGLGEHFSFTSTITNQGSGPATDLVAHLNVVSLAKGPYVDPEDWSSRRTQYLPPIPAGESLTLDWEVQAVNPGSIGVYVAVLPRDGSGRPITGPTIHADIAQRQTLNSDGVLPLALGIPALIGLLALGLRYERRRGRTAEAPESGTDRG